MKEVIDRLPLGNQKNNILRTNIPSNTSLANLITLLNSGLLCDVMTNNATDEANKGAAQLGTDIDAALFYSIDEAVNEPNMRVDVRAGTATVTGSMVYVPFNRLFMFPPTVVATCIDVSAACIVKGVTTEGFYALMRYVNGGATATGTLYYIACLDTTLRVGE